MPKHQNSLFAEVRRQDISALVQKEGKITVNALCEKFSVSPATIRTDLKELESSGQLKRTHGGAIMIGNAGYELTSKEKVVQNIAAKAAIAKEAQRFVCAGDAIAVDTGTTGLELAKLLVSEGNLTVVTNDLETALFLEYNSDVNIMLLGGIVRKHFCCTLGSFVMEALDKIHIDTLFLATNGVSLEHGLSTPNVEVANIKRKLIQTSSRVVLLADKSKFQNNSFIYFASLEDIDVIISDADIGEKLKDTPNAGHIEFIHVDVE